MTDPPYNIELTRSARRALSTGLPADVAAGAVELFAGPLSTSPHRIGKRLNAPLDGVHSARLMRDWRVLYIIDDEHRRVVVRWIRHRSDAYQT